MRAERRLVKTTVSMHFINSHIQTTSPQWVSHSYTASSLSRASHPRTSLALLGPRGHLLVKLLLLDGVLGLCYCCCVVVDLRGGRTSQRERKRETETEARTHLLLLVGDGAPCCRDQLALRRDARLALENLSVDALFVSNLGSEPARQQRASQLSDPRACDTHRCEGKGTREERT